MYQVDVFYLFAVRIRLFKKVKMLYSVLCFKGLKEFCRRIELERVKTLVLPISKYTDIGFLITKTEHLILGTSSGKAKSMANYYTHWERKVFDSIVKMVVR